MFERKHLPFKFARSGAVDIFDVECYDLRVDEILRANGRVDRETPPLTRKPEFIVEFFGCEMTVRTRIEISVSREESSSRGFNPNENGVHQQRWIGRVLLQSFGRDQVTGTGNRCNRSRISSARER